MDVPGFLLGSGFALLIVLLGWADQIVSKNKDTKEIERDFLNKAGIKSEQYKQIITNTGSTDESLAALFDFLSTTKQKDVELFSRIKKIRADLLKLENKYCSRFWILLSMNIALFISGVSSVFLCKQQSLFMLLLPAAFVIVIFANLISTYNLERRHVKNIASVLENL